VSSGKEPDVKIWGASILSHLLTPQQHHSKVFYRQKSTWPSTDVTDPNHNANPLLGPALVGHIAKMLCCKRHKNILVAKLGSLRVKYQVFY